MVLALGDEPNADGEEVQWGQSHLGEAYDEQPRPKPWIMEGSGEANSPVTSTSPEPQRWFDQGVALLHDPGFENARRYHVYDDFEECELHATILPDRNHDVHWFQIGGEPFMDFDFLEEELRRLEQGVVHELRVSEPPR